MTTAKKSGTSAKKTTTSKRSITASKSAFRKSDWMLIPLGLVVATCMTIVVMKAYVLTYLLTPGFYEVFWFPPIPSLLITIFGVVYIYKTLRRKRIGHIARAITYALFIVFLIFLIQIAFIMGGKGHECMGLFGMPRDCSEVSTMMLYMFFANPYSLILLSSLAILGTMSLLIQEHRS